MPEGIIDVIPVDLVVATILAAAARGPVDPSPDVVQIASGSINPLKYGKLFDLVSGWFTEHPVYDEHNQPIPVPRWSFPGRGRVARQLQRAQRSLETADRVLSTLPLRGRHAVMSASLEERRQQLERASGYVKLYGAYAECEAIYQLDRLTALWDSLDDADQAAFCFDPSSVDWTHYVQQVHLPSMVEQARLKMAPGSGTTRTESRSTRQRGQVLAPERHLAVFDLENTLIASNVVASYAWLATREMDDLDRVRFAARTLAEAPRLLALDRRDRSDFLRYFYRPLLGRPDGPHRRRLHRDAQRPHHHQVVPPGDPARPRAPSGRTHDPAHHGGARLRGGAPAAPVRPHHRGRDGLPGGRTRRGGIRRPSHRRAPHRRGPATRRSPNFADTHGLDLRESVAYADSTSDLPMLEAVGFPVAVNPETKLAALARRRGWLIEHWSTSAGAPAKLLPMAPRNRGGARRAELRRSA